VSLPSSDVLEGQDGPVSVSLALSDGLHSLTCLGQCQHLIVFIVSTQSERVVVSVEGGGGAGVTGLGTRAEWSREVETKIHSVADLLRGTLWKLEEMLVVWKHMIESSILLLIIITAGSAVTTICLIIVMILTTN